MTNQEYNQILRQARKKELVLRKAVLQENLELLNEVNLKLETALANNAIDGTLRKDQLVAMKHIVEKDLDTFQEAYTLMTHTGINAQTRITIERNGTIFYEVEGTRKLLDVVESKVLLDVFRMKEKDGLILSDRIWRMTEDSKLFITNRIQQGILLGEAHGKVARDLKQFIKGSGGLRYKSERLVTTEMAKAYKHANEQSVQMMRKGSKYMWFEKWELSPAHPRPDVCDLQASHDEGEGPGVYKTAPNRHPGCLCYIYPVYREKRGEANYPDASEIKPDTTDLSKSQHKMFKELK